MAQTAKLISSGESQAVCLPEEYRFSGTEVLIRRDMTTGDVILSRKPFDWTAFFAECDDASIPPDFLCDEERSGGSFPLDPLDWYDK